MPSQREFGKWYPGWGREKPLTFFTVFHVPCNLWYIFLLIPQWEASKHQEKPAALQRGQPDLFEMRIFSFFCFFGGYFGPSWIRSGLDLEFISTDPVTSLFHQDPDQCISARPHMYCKLSLYMTEYLIAKSAAPFGTPRVLCGEGNFYLYC